VIEIVANRVIIDIPSAFDPWLDNPLFGGLVGVLADGGVSS
jgi:hypothetical protein